MVYAWISCIDRKDAFTNISSEYTYKEESRYQVGTHLIIFIICGNQALLE